MGSAVSGIGGKWDSVARASLGYSVRGSVPQPRGREGLGRAHARALQSGLSEPSPGADVARGGPQSRCRCGKGRAAVPVQTWAAVLASHTARPLCNDRSRVRVCVTLVRVPAAEPPTAAATVSPTARRTRGCRIDDWLVRALRSAIRGSRGPAQHVAPPSVACCNAVQRVATRCDVSCCRYR